MDTLAKLLSEYKMHHEDSEIDADEDEFEFDLDSDGADSVGGPEEPEMDDMDDDDDFDMDDDDDFDPDMEAKPDDLEGRLDDLEDKMTTVLSKLSQVLAQSMVDDEEDDDDFDMGSDDMDADMDADDDDASMDMDMDDMDDDDEDVEKESILAELLEFIHEDRDVAISQLNKYRDIKKLVLRLQSAEHRGQDVRAVAKELVQRGADPKMVKHALKVSSKFGKDAHSKLVHKGSKEFNKGMGDQSASRQADDRWAKELGQHYKDKGGSLGMLKRKLTAGASMRHKGVTF